MKACSNLVNCLVDNVLRLELATDTSSPRLVACFSTLHLFCKVKPELLVPHTMTIQPYLDIKCSVSIELTSRPLVRNPIDIDIWLCENETKGTVSSVGCWSKEM